MSIGDVSPGLGAMLAQLAPAVKSVLDKIQPLLNQPVIRMPYNLPLSRSQVIAAGASGQVLTSSDFSHSLEWPFEVRWVKFSQDIAHTFRDWRVGVQDQTFNQPFQKSNSLVADLVDDNTGKWVLDFPWIVRPKGGALNVIVDNEDDTNPITVDINFGGYLLIPR